MHYISVVWHRLFSIKHNIDGWSLNIILSFKRKKEKKKKKKKKKSPSFLPPSELSVELSDAGFEWQMTVSSVILPSPGWCSADVELGYPPLERPLNQTTK